MVPVMVTVPPEVGIVDAAEGVGAPYAKSVLAADVRDWAPFVMVTARFWPVPVPAAASQVAVVCAVVTVADSHATPPRAIAMCEVPRGPKDVPVTVIVPPAVVRPAAGSMAVTEARRLRAARPPWPPT